MFRAADRDHQGAVLADQDRRVEDAVLLGPAKLFAVEDEDPRVPLVDDPQVRYRPALVDLGDACLAVRDGLRQRHVPRPPFGLREQRVDGKAAGGLRRAQLEELDQRGADRPQAPWMRWPAPQWSRD